MGTLSVEIDGLTPPFSPEVAPASREMRTPHASAGGKPSNQTDDCERKHNRLLASAALVYTCKSTSGFLFYSDGGFISTGVKTLTAQSTVGAEMLATMDFGVRDDDSAHTREIHRSHRTSFKLRALRGSRSPACLPGGSAT